MKRQRKLISMMAVLMIVCIAAYSAISYEGHKEKIKTSGEVILDLNAENFTSISWTYDKKEFSFFQDETWLYQYDLEFPVDEEKLFRVMDLFDGLGASFIIESPEEISQYGLDDPICTIEWTVNETEYEMIVGDYSAMDQERYVSLGDGNVYLITKDPLDYVDVELDDFLMHDEIPSLSNVVSVTISGEKEAVLINDEDNTLKYHEDDIYVLQIDGKEYSVDADKAEDYLRGIGYLSLSSYVTYAADEQDIGEYGLDSPVLKIDVVYLKDKKEESMTLSIGKNKDDYVVRLDESNMIYELSETDYEDLCKIEYNDLRHEEVFISDFDDVSQIDVELEGNEYIFMKDGKKILYQNLEIEFDDVQNAIENLSIHEFTDEAEPGKEEMRIIMHLDESVHDAIEIILYRYDGKDCIVKVNGSITGLIERCDVIDLIETVQSIVLN